MKKRPFINRILNIPDEKQFTISLVASYFVAALVIFFEFVLAFLESNWLKIIVYILALLVICILAKKQVEGYHEIIGIEEKIKKAKRK